MARLLTQNHIQFSSRSLGVRDRGATGGVDVGFVDQLNASATYAAQMHEANAFIAGGGLALTNPEDQQSKLLAVSSQAVYPGKARYRAQYGIDETVPLTVDPFLMADEQTAGRRTITQPRRYNNSAETTIGGLTIRETEAWTTDNSKIDISDYAGSLRLVESIHTIRVPFVLPYWPLDKNDAAWNKLNSNPVMVLGKERAANTLKYLGLGQRRAFLQFDGSVWYSGYYVFEWSPQPDVTYVVRGGSGEEITSVINGIRYTSRERFVYLQVLSTNSMDFVGHFPHELGAGPAAP